MNALRLSLLCILLLTTVASACAGIYKWVDDDGRVQFSDSPPPQVGAERIELPEINTYEGVSVEELEEGRDTRPKKEKHGKHKKVVMYSAPWCGVCTRARRFFQAKGIPFRELDIEKSQSARRKWEGMNAKGVPLILVGGKRMNGFTEKRFMDLYRN